MKRRRRRDHGEREDVETTERRREKTKRRERRRSECLREREKSIEEEISVLCKRGRSSFFDGTYFLVMSFKGIFV